MLCLSQIIVKGQLHIDTSFTPKQLVDKFLLGQGVRVGNVTYSGNKAAIAHFSFSSPIVDVDNGILLSTGSAFNAIGPNNYPYTTTGFLDVKTQRKLKGDKDLNKIAHNMSFDAAILEFDFIPLNNKISFTYMFGSEEYPEYVDSRYNDVFGFFITGPKYRSKNLATLPLSIVPISINSINQHENKNGFVDNDFFMDVKPTKVLPGQAKTAGKKEENEKYEIPFKINKKKQKKLNPALMQALQYDGLTRELEAWCYVIPYQKYHIKIAIGDVGDNSYDSGVFLAGGTFNSSRDDKQPKFKNYEDISNRFNFDSLLYGPPPVKSAALVKQERQDSIDDAEAERFQITNVNFDSDSYVLPDSSQKHLRELSEYIQRRPNHRLELYGYTDNQGNKEYNQKLSENRATNVSNFLVARGINKKKITIGGFNFERPLGDNSREEGRAANRRVEIIMIEVEPPPAAVKSKTAATKPSAKPVAKTNTTKPVVKKPVTK